MYVMGSVAWASGILEAFILSALFFIKLSHGAPMILVNLVRLVHKVLGYIAIILSMWALLSGLFSYDSKVKWLFIIHWGGYLVAWIFLEIIH